MESTWPAYFKAVVSRLSPKVVVPFVVAVVGVTVSGLLAGTFGAEQLVGYVVTFVYGVLGVSVPPSFGVTQKQVKRLR